jgi:hypothetical protein
MAQRGRPTRASLALVSARIEAIPRQSAPSELTKEESEIWNTVVAAEPADWFSASTRPILAQYCRHIIRARRTAELIQNLEISVAEALNGSPAERLAVMMSATEALDRL